jgi:hypothetical protein
MLRKYRKARKTASGDMEKACQEIRKKLNGGWGVVSSRISRNKTVSIPQSYPSLEVVMLSRRRFLAATAAAPVVLSHASAVAANEKLTLGFIGVGTM